MTDDRNRLTLHTETLRTLTEGQTPPGGGLKRYPTEPQRAGQMAANDPQTWRCDTTDCWAGATHLG